MMKPTDGELMTAATLTAAVLDHASQSVPRDPDKAMAFILDRFHSVLTDIQEKCPVERYRGPSLDELLRAVQRRDTV